MSQFEIREKPVFLPVGDVPRRVTVTGDTVSYGDLGVTHSERNGQIKDGDNLTFGVGQWLRTEGQSLLTIAESDDFKPQVTAPVEKPKKKPKAKAEAPKKAAAKAKAKKR